FTRAGDVKISGVYDETCPGHVLDLPFGNKKEQSNDCSQNKLYQGSVSISNSSGSSAIASSFSYA
ncbi:MAG: hypothetical protein ACLRQQ_15260, partial [Acutalibacteraceae bacterium]